MTDHCIFKANSKMALPDIVQAASSLTFQGRDHVIPGHFALGLGIPREFWLGFWDPRLFDYGIRETGSIKADSQAFQWTSDLSLVRDSCIFRCPCFIYFQTPLLDFFQVKHIQIKFISTLKRVFCLSKLKKALLIFYCIWHPLFLNKFRLF